MTPPLNEHLPALWLEQLKKDAKNSPSARMMRGEFLPRFGSIDVPKRRKAQHKEERMNEMRGPMSNEEFSRRTGLTVMSLSTTNTPFEDVMQHILNVEGRGYTDHPQDSGGPTKFGITQAALSTYRGTKASANDVRELTEQEASQIYKVNYFDRMNLGFVKDARIAMCLMDQGVNRGTSTAITMAQVMMNRQTGMKLQEDGKNGPKTIAAMESLDPVFFCREYIQLAQHGYVDIVKRKNSQLVFLTGWMNRTHILQDLITTARTTATPIIVPKPDVKEEPVSTGKLAPFKWAQGELGQSEISGSKDNARIVYYHGFTTLKATDDETPWCSSFMCAAHETQGIRSTRSAAAKSWATWGKEGDGSVGDIAVFKRTGGHHVAFINKKFQRGASVVNVLGGNQSNKVRVSDYDASNLIAIRRA